MYMYLGISSVKKVTKRKQIDESTVLNKILPIMCRISNKNLYSQVNLYLAIIYTDRSSNRELCKLPTNMHVGHC